MMKPSICRDVVYRSRTGNYSVPAKITATTDTLYRPNVDAGYIAGLSSDTHVHLTVFTPGRPGIRGAENVDMVVPDSDARPIFPNVAGLYQEYDVPFWDPATYDGEIPPDLADVYAIQPAGTWMWPPRV